MIPMIFGSEFVRESQLFLAVFSAGTAVFVGLLYRIFAAGPRTSPVMAAYFTQGARRLFMGSVALLIGGYYVFVPLVIAFFPYSVYVIVETIRLTRTETE